VTGAPYAPWPLVGESVSGLARWRGGAPPPLPSGLSPLPGRWLVTASRYLSSPVGPFLELVVGRPARLGRHPGWCVLVHAVDSQAARVGGTLNWGFPSDVHDLEWGSDGRDRGLVWPERGLRVIGRPTRVVVPVLLRIHALQRRSDGPVFVPTTSRGIGRYARVHVEVKEDDELAPLAGRHVGLTVNGLNARVDPARQPLGLLSSLRAPLRAPVPQVWYDGERAEGPAPGLAMVSSHPGG